MRRRQILKAAAAGASALTLAGCTVTAKKVEKTTTHEFDTADSSALSLSNSQGDITVESTTSDTVEVRAKKVDQAGNEDVFSKLTVTASRTGDTLEIGVDDDTADVKMLSASWVHLTVAVPDALALDHVSSDDGDVVVTGTHGDSTVETNDGTVKLTDTTGDVDARTNDGDVEVTDTTGDVDARTNDGDVEVTDITGDVDARTNDGNVTLRNVDGFVGGTTDDGDVSATNIDGLDTVESMDGEIDVEVPALDGDTEISTDDGDITVAVAQSLDTELSARTNDGDVTVHDLEGTFDGQSNDSSLDLTLGDGTHDTTIETHDGDITISSL
jgi:hypothetical protein